MAQDTPLSLRGKMIYSVFVRAYGEHGTFEDVERDLPRIRELGTDIVWLMPIHPVGRLDRKGTMGSPYAIRDYFAVNDEYGTQEDFKRLVDAIHAQGMTCLIDVVYNHTAHDSVLLREHPEYFYRRSDGEFGNRAGVWEDVYDLDYDVPGLWDVQIAALKKWVELGVDGFRCDVASIVPVGFWLRAREETRRVNPDTLFLAESVHPDFVVELRSKGFYCASDCELYQAFDILYDYDVRGWFDGYFEGKNTLRDYLDALARQEAIYPANYVKLRFLENHDQPRAGKMIPDGARLNMWTAFYFFMKGSALLYAGQEARDAHTPSLFERDPVDWSGMDGAFTMYLQKLAAIKHDPIMQRGFYRIQAAGEKGNVAAASYTAEGETLWGVFNLENETGTVSLEIPDGVYRGLLDGEEITVSGGRVVLTDKAQIFRVCGV